VAHPTRISATLVGYRFFYHLTRFAAATMPNTSGITLNNTHYRVDLVFYHRILRCFVLLDLKVDKLQHQDIGQMNMYLGYFAAEETTKGDNPPIGIILTRNKDELLVEYATYEMNSQLFVQKYQLYLPDREELRRELELTLQLSEESTNPGVG
jgi:YhcG PDDEXK nuclease domain